MIDFMIPRGLAFRSGCILSRVMSHMAIDSFEA